MAKPELWRRDLACYPFECILQTRFGDMDVLGHVNNVAMAGLFENGRVRFNRSLVLPHAHGVRWLIVNVDIAYLAEVHYPHDVTIATGIGHIGNRSWTVLSAAFQNGGCVATCDSTLVYTNAEGPTALPYTYRECFQTFMLTGR
jgi:acyl-CoA thioester hydrolase